MPKVIGDVGNPAAFFLFEHYRDPSNGLPGKCAWIQQQEQSGLLLLKALSECLMFGLFPGLKTVYSDYLTNAKGFSSAPFLQLELPFRAEDEKAPISYNIFKRRVPIENISVEEPLVAADGGNFLSSGGMVVSPLCAIALAKSLGHVVVAYRGEARLSPDENMRLVSAVKRRIDKMQPGWDKAARNRILRERTMTDGNFMGPEVVRSTLNRLAGVKFLQVLPTGLHVMVWSRQKK